MGPSLLAITSVFAVTMFLCCVQSNMVTLSIDVMVNQLCIGEGNCSQCFKNSLSFEQREDKYTISQHFVKDSKPCFQKHNTSGTFDVCWRYLKQSPFNFTTLTKNLEQLSTCNFTEGERVIAEGNSNNELLICLLAHSEDNNMRMCKDPASRSNLPFPKKYFAKPLDVLGQIEERLLTSISTTSRVLASRPHLQINILRNNAQTFLSTPPELDLRTFTSLVFSRSMLTFLRTGLRIRIIRSLALRTLKIKKQREIDGFLAMIRKVEAENLSPTLSHTRWKEISKNRFSILETICLRMYGCNSAGIKWALEELQVKSGMLRR